MVVFTDGSATEGRSNGGAAFIAKRKTEEGWKTCKVERMAAGEICSSFQAEMRAIESALKWLHNKKESWSRSKIVTDSQSSLESIKRRDVVGRCELKDAVEEWLERLESPRHTILFEWVPSHCGVGGNEEVDREAAEAAKMDQRGVSCSFEGVKKRLKRVERRTEWINKRCKMVYGAGEVRIKLEDSWTRQQMVFLARLRSGHSLDLAAYRKRIGIEEDGRCPRCEEEEETLEHVLECPAGELMRRECGVEKAEHLISRPCESLKFWEWWKGARKRN